jgi:hypothetical protein
VLETSSGFSKGRALVIIDASDRLPESVLIEQSVLFGPVSTDTPDLAYEKVCVHAGAIRPKRDSHDDRIVREVQSGQTTFGDGIISSQTEVGGWPKLLSARPKDDVDRDGMPDEWERLFHPNGDLSWDGIADSDGDGYPDLEEYLNNTDPNK